MLRIASQTVHTLDGTSVASEVLARLHIGSQLLTPHAFMHGCSPESWYALDIEVLKMVGTSPVLRAAKGPTFVNISPATLENDQYLASFCKQIAQQVDSRSGPLVIEIPEKSAVAGKQLVNKLQEIEFAGAQVAIDDYGRDHAVQNRLEIHPWRYCKIDLAALQEQSNLNWLDQAIRYARDHGIQLIMEKLESFRDLDVLSPVKNTAWYQGYVYARPALLETPKTVFGGKRGNGQADEPVALSA